METFKKIAKYLIKLPAKFAVVLIKLYQLTLSPDHSWLRSRFVYGYCRHYPSCSEYTKQAISKNGLIQGAWMGVVRIIKCNPFVEPKVDTISNYTN